MPKKTETEKATSPLENLLLNKISSKKKFNFELGKHLEPSDAELIHHAFMTAFALTKDGDTENEKALTRLCKIQKIIPHINCDIEWPTLARGKSNEHERYVELPDLGEKSLNLEQCHNANRFYDGIDKFHINQIIISLIESFSPKDVVSFVEKYNISDETSIKKFKERMTKYADENKPEIEE